MSMGRRFLILRARGSWTRHGDQSPFSESTPVALRCDFVHGSSLDTALVTAASLDVGMNAKLSKLRKEPHVKVGEPEVGFGYPEPGSWRRIDTQALFTQSTGARVRK